jgi:hypothetical protein
MFGTLKPVDVLNRLYFSDVRSVLNFAPQNASQLTSHFQINISYLYDAFSVTYLVWGGWEALPIKIYRAETSGQAGCYSDNDPDWYLGSTHFKSTMFCQMWQLTHFVQFLSSQTNGVTFKHADQYRYLTQDLDQRQGLMYIVLNLRVT